MGRIPHLRGSIGLFACHGVLDAMVFTLRALAHLYSVLNNDETILSIRRPTGPNIPPSPSLVSNLSLLTMRSSLGLAHHIQVLSCVHGDPFSRPTSLRVTVQRQNA